MQVSLVGRCSQSPPMGVCRAAAGVSKAGEQACHAWLRDHLQRSYEPLLEEPWILDVDSIVKPLYGHQQGAT